VLFLHAQSLLRAAPLAQFYDGVCSALGSLLFANLLPSTIYQLSATGNDCFGAACFGPTHTIIAVLSALGCGAALVLSARSAPLYAQIAAGARTEML
jgi:hypothetical protein